MFGDWGKKGDLAQQKAVAAALRQYGSAHSIRAENLLLLGDNFYGQFDGGVNCPRWKTQFEDMYPRSDFDCPCYAILGNHDYQHEPVGKPEAQLAYASATPGTRWKMPAKWYSFVFPEKDPLVTFIALDSNMPNGNGKQPTLTPAERDAQNVWLKAELAKPRRTPYLVVLGHHPVYSNGHHGDTPSLVRDWDPLLREHEAHLYLCGHDHDLQHLEFAGHPTSFVISGGGGAQLTKIERSPAERGPYGQSIAGFTHLQVTREHLLIRHIDVSGQVLHSFSKTPEGRVAILDSGV